MEKFERKPDISVVIVVYNMAREAPRTLHSLSAAYQRHINPDDYEVIVVDNGSNPPFDSRVIEGLSGNFRLIRIDPASPSPAAAANRGLAEARGDVIGMMIDGARIATPGLLHYARHGAQLYDCAVVATLGWYLGQDLQSWAIRAGYNQTREDELLASIGWPQDGYRLFEIATMDESSTDGWVAPISETNALFMRRELWNMVGGLDERFDLPGGGLLNLDTYRRAGELPGAELVLLLGEGTFHQVHAGTATNAPVESLPGLLARWGTQYEAIRGCSFAHPKLKNAPTYLGTLHRAALARFARAAIDPVQPYGAPEPPLGRHFDRELWSLIPAAQPADPTIAALVDLAQNEFRAQRYESAAAVSRLVRERAPDEPEPQRLLSLIGSWLSVDGPTPDRRARYHCALGEAYRLLGNSSAATSEYQKALTFEPDLPKAHNGLAMMLKDAVAPRCTVLLPVIRPPYFLPNAIESVLAQTVSEFELFVICDGAPPETIECAQDFARRDPRVKVFPFPKSKRAGEAHLHTALTNASGNFVAYLEDDDLWFPNHLEELEKLLLTVDFGNTIHVTGHPDGHVESLPCDLGNQDFRQRFVDDLFNRFGYSFCGHRLDAYRSLSEGWAPTPVGMYPDLHMWRKFFRMSDFKFGTRMAVTAVALPSYLREHMSLEERASEAGVWVSRIVDEHERANIVETAWRSVVGLEIQHEQDILNIDSSYRAASAALAQMEAMHPGSLQKLGHAIEVQANAQLEVQRLTDKFNLSQHCLSIVTAKTEEQEAAIATHKADLANLTGQVAEWKAAYERIVRTRSWRIIQPLRSAIASARLLSQRLRRGKM